MSGIIRRLAYGCVIAAPLSCGGGDSTGPSVNAPGKITISPDTPSVVRGSSITLVARVTDASGRSASNTGLQWSSGDNTIATVNSQGLVTGVKFGTTQITASVGSTIGSTQLVVLFPAKDSVVASNTDSVTVHIGNGSSLTIPPGSLPAGVTITVQEVAATDSAGGIPVGRALMIVTSGVSTPSGNRLGAAKLISNLQVGSGSTTSANYLVRMVNPFDYTQLNGGNSNLGYSVNDPSTASSIGPVIYAPVNPSVASTPLGPTTTATFTLFGAATGQHIVVTPALQDRTCSDPKYGKHFYRVDGATTSDPAKTPLILIHGWQPGMRHCSIGAPPFSSFFPEKSDWSSLIAGIPSSLLSYYEVWIARYPTFQHIDRSASDLAADISQFLPNRNVVIVAHSMGGLVAGRYMVAHPENKVTRLITLATPWLGSPLAEPGFGTYRQGAFQGCSLFGYVAGSDLVETLTGTDGGSDLWSGNAFLTQMLPPTKVASLNSKVTAIFGGITAGTDHGRVYNLGYCLLSNLGNPSNDGVVPDASAFATTNSSGTAFSFTAAFRGVGNDHSEIVKNFPFVLSELAKPIASVVASVTISPSSASVSVGSTVGLSATAFNPSGDVISGAAVQWSSGDATIATVGATGVVTGIAQGTATITATVSGKTASATITVTPAATTLTPTIALSATTASFSATAGGSNPSAQTVQVTNGGTGILSGLSTGVTYQSGQAIGWLSAALNATTAPATLTLTPTVGTLPAGTYNATVALSSSATGVTNSPRTVAVQFTVATQTPSTLGWSSVASGIIARLWSVWGISASDVWAVGDNKGTILHYNGTTWSSVGSGTNQALFSVWGISASDVWAVGDNATGTGTITHYNGTSWLSVSSPTSSALRSVWGTSASDVWAVGYSGGVLSGGTLIHYDGATWSNASNAASPWLYAIWGTSASDVWVVGVNGTIKHYNGTTWSSVSSGTTTELLISVWGTSASDVWVVGSNGTILHYNGTTWSSVSSGTTEYLYSVWGTSASDVWAAGLNGTIIHYNGAKWSSVSSGTTQDLFGVWGSFSSDVWAVGANGTILHGAP